MRQFSVGTQPEDAYYQDIAEMTDYFIVGITPPMEPLAKFDEITAKFVKNLMVEYSPYLSHYKDGNGKAIENPEHFRQSVSYLTSWNRALDRFAMAETGKTTPTGKPIQITPKNKDVRAEIEKAGYDFNELLTAKIQTGIIAENEEEI
jgi:hypothetical protein